MMTLTFGIALAAAFGAAVIAGVFFTFSNFVMKALARLPSKEGIAAMQAINVTVINAGFLGVFMGTAILCLVLAVLAIANWTLSPSPWLLGGAVSYLGGTWLVTIAGNVPLNNRLASIDGEDAAAADVWTDYLSRWTTLNSRRAWASGVATVLIAYALFQ